jgi:hypothetical protein
MAVVEFWDQGGPMVNALRSWIEQIGRTVEQVKRIDFHEFNERLFDPEKDAVTMTFYFADEHRYEMMWVPGHLIARR